MTAPLRSNQHASAIAAIAASQNTAPVAEFRCLFTHDIRRKQKRWHDGFVKFHSFNSRVMAYDLSRNFLGDTYHKDCDELHEGDELSLNNGLLIEVAEPMGVTHTDLTPLLSKKTRDDPPGPSTHSQTKVLPRPSSVAPANAQTPAAKLRHKSLNTILGAPKGPIGKAQPIRSPYEVRKEKERKNEVEERAAKRQKTDHDQDVGKHEQLWTKTKTAGPPKARQPQRFIPPAATVISLDSEPDLHPPILSDVTLPDTPPQAGRKKQEKQKTKTATSGQLLVQTPKIPKGKVPIPSIRALETPWQPAPPSSPPVSVSNRLSNIEFALQPVKVARKDPSPPPSASSSPPVRKTRCLRLAAGVKRGKLLCQALPSESAEADSVSRVVGGKARRTASYVVQKEDMLSGARQKDHASAPSKRPPRAKRTLADAGEDDVPKRVRVSQSPALPSPSLQEDPEVGHGHMDQQLLVISSPVHSHLPSSPPINTVAKSKSRSRQTASEVGLEGDIPEPQSANSKPLPTEEKTQKRPVSKKAQRTTAASRPLAPVLDPGMPASRDEFPARSEASKTPSKTLSTCRIVPFSKGLRTSKSLAKALADEIEDDEDGEHGEQPPKRGFRRVQSENDASVSSVAQDGEKHSLPGPSSSPAADTTVIKKKKDGGLDALIKRTDPRLKFKRMQRLEIQTHMVPPAGVEEQEGGEAELDSPVEDVDVGPWSTEAGDLLDWRPLAKD